MSQASLPCKEERKPLRRSFFKGLKVTL